MGVLAIVIVCAASLAGVVLTAMTLPGIWFSIVTALLCWWWRPELFSVWTLVAAAGIGLLAEVLELVASAAGASRAGGSRRAGWWAIGGAVAGAIAGSVLIPVPIAGTILGGAIGAGVAAFAAEPHRPGPGAWRHRARVGRGAATGRLLATVIKTALAGAVAIVLCVAAIAP